MATTCFTRYVHLPEGEVRRHALPPGCAEESESSKVNGAVAVLTARPRGEGCFESIVAIVTPIAPSRAMGVTAAPIQPAQPSPEPQARGRARGSGVGRGAAGKGPASCPLVAGRAGHFRPAAADRLGTRFGVRGPSRNGTVQRAAQRHLRQEETGRQRYGQQCRAEREHPAE